jgi:intein/homing endonuclease
MPESNYDNAKEKGKEGAKAAWEDINVKSEDLMKTVKKLLKKGNINRISIKDKEGNVVVEVPVNIGILGGIMAPGLAAIGALAAVMTECTISIEKKEERNSP